MTDLDFDAIEGMLMPCSCIDRPAEHYPTCPTGARDALIAALREAREATDNLTRSLMQVTDDAHRIATEREEARAEVDHLTDLLADVNDSAGQWRRRYDALRDGVTGLHVERQGMAGCRECGYDWPCPTAALVARAEGGES